MQEGRWTTITPSQYQHERDALRHVQDLLPDEEPYRAWANFTFTAQTGHVYEVDLLVAAPGGLYLVEIKSLNGRLAGKGPNWIQTTPTGSTRIFDNPLHLANAKAQRLKSLLHSEAYRQRLSYRVPFIQAAVFLSVPGLEIDLPDHHRHWVFGREPKPGDPPGQLPPIGSALLKLPPQDDRRRLRPELSRALPKLLEGIGIARSRLHFRVGSWELERQPFDTGPTWQDYLATHAQLPAERRRIRIYLAERNAPQSERERIARAARREMLALHGISHPGIVQVDTMEPHESGPALIFRHDPRSRRLDQYLAEYGDRLDAETRVGMIRQLAEAVGYAHSRHLYHRALSARSVLVTPGARRRSEPEGAAWRRPQLQISDWQAATRGADSVGNGASSPSLRVLPTTHVGLHFEQSAEVYLAPEVTAPTPDPVAMDVFGLGALSYLLLSGQPPAASRTELLGRLDREHGLRPSSVADSVSEFMDELVQAATAPVPAQRLTGVAEFLELLQTVEEELAGPRTASVPPAAPEEEPDPLEARPGDLVGGEWRVAKRLGTGSTSRAFLATSERTGRQEVLKVALSDEKAARLEAEARALGRLADSRVIHLARPEPIRIGPRTILVLEHAGELTVARKLRDDGRLTVDELETFSDYLFGALDYLEGEGVVHRDVKPDNIAIRERPNKTRQLVLFDFSLASASDKDIQVGTPRYLDPFLGVGQRSFYDVQAERYALAVTLHEMASGELPVWGDGATEPRYTQGPPVLAAEAFDPAIREGLVAFFQRALHREARQRFETLREMRDAWQQVFRVSDAAKPVGAEPLEGEAAPAAIEDEAAAALAREEAASRATRATTLEAAGLTPRAVSAAHRLDATTVGDLLRLGSKQVFELPGLGARTRKELLGRISDWRARLREEEVSPLAAGERKAAEAEVSAASEKTGDEQGPSAELSRVGLDAIATLLVPPSRGRQNATEVEATRLLLGLPDGSGALPGLPAWAQQPAVAKALGVTPGRVAQILSKQRRRWRREPVVLSVRAELIELLAGGGRVMGVTELASALLLRRGSTRTGERLRRAIATAAVRAAVEVDSTHSEPRLLTRRHGERLLVALEVDEQQDGPETPTAFALLNYADALGKAADRLAAQEVLPAPATVLRELSAVRVPGPGTGASLDERRLVQLAAAASERAVANARLEVYPRDLDPVRALRLAQAGVVPPPAVPGRDGLTPEQVQERVRARFPELPPLPVHPELDRLLGEAGFELRWRDGFYTAPAGGPSWPGSMVTPRRTTWPGGSRWAAESPELAAAAKAEQQLAGAAAEGGFRALTVRLSRYLLARDELASRFAVEPLNVAALFLAAFHELVDPRRKPTWATILGADAAEPGSRDAVKLGEYVSGAWERARPRLLAALATGAAEPLLLHDAAPLARYGAMDLLHAMAERARAGERALWLLCPMDDPGHPPRLDGTVVPVVTENEWVALPDAWVANQHRSGERAS
jgi:serine/threonine protein kinase